MKIDLKPMCYDFFDEVGFPEYKTSGAAGLDMYARIDEPVTIMPGESALIPTGISVGIHNPNYGMFLYNRSGLSAKHGVGLINAVGVIDSDYLGEVCFPLHNYSQTPYRVGRGDRIGQAVIQPVERAEFVVVDEHRPTERGAGGFGSTGK